MSKWIVCALAVVLVATVMMAEHRKQTAGVVKATEIQAMPTRSTPPDQAARYATAQAAFDEGNVNKALIQWSYLGTEGYAPAQYKLALIYSTGLGVARDEKLAQTWYWQAAESGIPEAQAEVRKLVQACMRPLVLILLETVGRLSAPNPQWAAEQGEAIRKKCGDDRIQADWIH